MKKIIIPISALFVAGLYSGQTTAPSTAENYIYSKTYLDYDGNNQPVKSSETIQYFDGLGRPKQVINIKASPSNKDLVTTIPYDGFGRQVDSWLPVPMPTMNGAIQSGVDVAAQTYYGDSSPFAHNNVEASPLSRVISQVQPGLDWQGHPVQLNYEVNADGEVKKYTATFDYGSFESNITLSQTGYLANQLYKNTVTDEDGNATIEFKNKDGQVVLVRKVISATENADTYYVYNEYNQLAYVIPPLASVLSSLNPAVLDNLCYQYKYDHRNRLVEKKLPGKGKEYMIYDKQDRLIMVQDANLNTQGQWLFTKYDQFGRIVYTGITSSSSSRQSIQSDVNNNTANPTNNESRSATPVSYNGIDLYYTNVSIPYTISTLLSVNYYDTYPTGTPAFTSSIPNQSAVLTGNVSSGLTTRSLSLATYVKNIEDDNWTKNYSYYDLKGRIFATQSINHLGGYTQIESRLDFAGVPQQTITRHKRLSTDTERVIDENFTYDSQNRLVKHTHKVDSNPTEILTQNEYNELSRITTKKVGGLDVSTPLQVIDYAYNIRGWMTKINDPANLNGKLFGYEIRYNNPVNSNITPGKFNGNIAEVDWNNGSENLLKRYNYDYDRLNRLKNAFYKEPTTGSSGNFDEYLTYDLNGNISNLKRSANPVSGLTSTLVDNLDYIYQGNRLTQVIENSLNLTGYEGGNNIIDYDLNGNMTTMKDKGIQYIGYNHLNVPDQFSITQADPFLGTTTNFGLNYLYRADGVKVRKTYSTGGGRGQSTTYKYTDYLDGFQYYFSETVAPCLWCRTSVAYEQEAFKDPIIVVPLAWTLDFVGTAEGFYSYTENRYIYQYKDHLGNARVSYAKKSDGNLEITDTNNYYAFGMNHIGGLKGIFGGYQSYKYNGKELQESGMYDYGARFYMPDLGRWGVVDPLAERYIKASPYHYAFNNPVFFKDPNGKQIIIYYQTEDGRQRQWTYSYSENRRKTGNEFLDNAIAGLDKLYTSDALNLDTNGDGTKDTNYLQKIIDDKRVLSVVEGENTRFYMGLSYNEKYKNWNTKDPIDIGKITFNSKKGLLFNNSEYNDKNQKDLLSRYESGKYNKEDKVISPTAGLGHELVHAGNFLLDNANYFQRIEPFVNPDKNGFTSNEEIRTTLLSNQVNESLNEPQRKVYWGITLPTESVTSNKLK